MNLATICFLVCSRTDDGIFACMFLFKCISAEYVYQILWDTRDSVTMEYIGCANAEKVKTTRKQPGPLEFGH